MRARHTAHSTPSFPVYSAAFLSPTELVLGGGGGTSKTGIKNKLGTSPISFKFDNTSFLGFPQRLYHNGEDAPMSMAAHPDGSSFVCGINSSAEVVAKGENLNCRVYAVSDDDKIEFISSVGTLGKDDPEDYQKVTVFSPDGVYLVVAGCSELSMLTIPELVSTHTRVDKGEIYDAAFSETTLVVATTLNLLVYSLLGKNPTVIERPKLPGGDTGTFRVAKQGTIRTILVYFIPAINTTPARGAKASQRMAYLVRWNTDGWKVDRIRKVGVKGLTCLRLEVLLITASGLPYGSSDCSVGLLDAFTLAFNPTSRLLVLIAIPDGLGDNVSWSYTITVIIAIFCVLFAIALQLFMRGAI
ncbi:WD40 repeat-like protein [Lactarius sanguifluus]|nr:WD40 repeat-like protein [Lactarius sanguifluus]